MFKKTWQQRAVALISSFSLVLQLLFPALFILATPVRADDVIVETTPTSEPTVTPEPTPEITISPEPTVTPELTPEAAATPAATLEPTPPSTTYTPVASDSPLVVTENTSTGELFATVIPNDISQIGLLDLGLSDVNQSASLITDKPDYAPTEIAVISGIEFTPETTYSLTISSTDDPATNTTVDVTTDKDGSFVYMYQLDGTYRPNYSVEIKLSDAVIANTTFTDSDTGYLSTGGYKNNSGVTTPENAYSSDNQYAVFGNSGDQVDYYNFNLDSLPSNIIVEGIQVQVEGKRTNNRDLNFSLSWNNGANFSSPETITTFSSSDTILLTGGQYDTWGHTWSHSDLMNDNFLMRVAVGNGAGSLSVDQIKIKVYWHLPDTTPPTCPAPTFSNFTRIHYVAGNTIYYSPVTGSGTGSFRVNITPTDDSGIQKVNFPTTTSTGGDVTSPPYYKAYNWTDSSTFNDSVNITCYDNSPAHNTSTSTFNVFKDSTPPTLSSVTLDDYTVQNGTTINVTSDGTDSGSGIGYCHAFWSTDTLYGSDIDLGDLGSDCDGPITVPAGSGTYYVIVRAGDNVGYFPNPVASSAVIVDNTFPSTTDDAGPGTEIFQISKTVTLTAIDTEGSGIADTKYCVANSGVVCTPNISGTTVNVSCPGEASCTKWIFYYSTDNAGNVESAEHSHNINIINDLTPPNITPHISPTPNAYGFNNSDVTVTWTVTDDESSISSTTGCGTTNVTTETTGQDITCSATSIGGTNSQTVTVKLDKTEPSANLVVTSGTPGSNGWYISDITVVTSCFDSISAIESYSSDQYQTVNTAGQVFNGYCTNTAGLTTNASPLTIKLDKTAPIVGTIAITPSSLFNSIFYIQNLSTISAPVSDSGNSGIDPTSCRYSINNGAGAFISVLSAFDVATQSCIFPNIDTSVATGVAISINDNAGNFFDTTNSWIPVTVDGNAPVVTNVDSDGQTYTNSTSSPQTIKVTFNEDITNTPTIAVSGATQTVTNCTDADDRTFCFNYSIPTPLSASLTVSVSAAKDVADNIMVNDNSHTFSVDTFTDTDSDGITDSSDNCPAVANPDQMDSDNDNIGDVCDNCSLVANPDQQDNDNDTLGNVCDLCPNTADLNNQVDNDYDGIGNSCDPINNYCGDGYVYESEQCDDGNSVDNDACSNTCQLNDTTPPTATISYDITTPTNTNVIATLNPSETVNITNNGGLDTYTFTANGSFTFEFADTAGNTGTAEAVVTNIDKVLPTVDFQVSNPIDDLQSGNSTQTFSASYSEDVSSCAINFGLNNGGFEQGDLTGWTTSGYDNWYVDNSDVKDGAYSARSGNMGGLNNVSSTLQRSITFGVNAILSFWWKVNSEGGWDYLSFYLDSALQNSISGSTSWQQLQYNLGTGDHNLQWVYSKDSSVTSGLDAGWVDDVRVSGGTGDSQDMVIDNQNHTASLTVSNLADGIHTYSIHCHDLASNLGTTSTRSLTIDTTAPNEPTPTPAAGDYTSDQAVTLASSDSGTGLSVIYYTIDGSEPNNTKTEYTSAITVDHSLTLKAIAYDVVGNASTILEATYGIAPVISAETEVTIGSATATITWTTDDLSTSRVVYDITSVSDATVAASLSGSNYGYANSTVEDSTKVTSHSVGLTSLTADTIYYYRVISHGSPEAIGVEQSFSTTSPILPSPTPTPSPSSNNSSSTSTSTSPASAPPCNDTKPGSAPTLLSAVAGANSVTLNWSQASTPVSYYLVTYGTEPGLQQYGNPNVGDMNTTSYTVRGLSGGSRYYFKVRAGNGCMPGDFSNEVSAVPGGHYLETIATDFEPSVLGMESADEPNTINAPPKPTNDTSGAVLGTDQSTKKGLDWRWLWLLLIPIIIFGYSRRRRSR